MFSCQNTKDGKLQSTLTEDDFIGVFELDPDRSTYEFGVEISDAIHKIERFDNQYKFTIDNIVVSGTPNKIESIVKKGKSIEKDSYTILKVQNDTRLIIDKYNTDGEFIEGIMRELLVEDEKIIMIVTEKGKLPQDKGFYINKQTYVKS